MPNFDTLTTVDAASVLLTAATPAYVPVNRAYMQGDHFQGGAEWVGPPPPPDMLAAALARLEKSWCPSPVINEMLENHMVGVVGNEPMFEFVPRESGEEEIEDAELDLINAAVGSWFDDREGLAILQEWVQRLRWAGRGSLRLFIPPDLLQEGADGFNLPDGVSTPEEALKYIYFECPEVEAGTVYTDPRTRREAGLYSYTEGDKKRVEVTFVGDGDGIEGQTVLRVVEEAAVIAEVVFPCGGVPLMYEAKLPLLFTNPVRRLQQALNMINTMLPINDSYAGFRSRDYFNVEPPKNEDSGDEEAPTLGPSQFMMWYSAPYEVVDENGRKTGETKYYPPQLITTEPVDSSNIREDLDHFDRLIRRFCKQEYTLMAGDGNSSAVALIQKRAVFANDLLKTAPAVEGALRWLQTAVWCFALYLSGNESQIEGFVEKYRATAKARLSTGPLTPDEERVVLERVAANLLSKETAMVLLGSDDPDAEKQKIQSEMDEELENLRGREVFPADATE